MTRYFKFIILGLIFMFVGWYFTNAPLMNFTQHPLASFLWYVGLLLLAIGLVTWFDAHKTKNQSKKNK